MEAAHHELLTKFSGKLRVAGSSYTGVGVHDCVTAGKDAAIGIKDTVANTGLESFIKGPRLVVVPDRR
jgi:oxygen-dependent protoporphyrinogen oxidase